MSRTLREISDDIADRDTYTGELKEEWIITVCEMLGVSTSDSSAWEPIRRGFRNLLGPQQQAFLDHSKWRPDIVFTAPYRPLGRVCGLLGIWLQPRTVSALELDTTTPSGRKQKRTVYVVPLPSELNYHSRGEDDNVYLVFKEAALAARACNLR